MSKDSTWGTSSVHEYLGKRTVDNSFAPLARYLSAGVSVLDVGCGPGSITIDIAKRVDPGKVIGIDLEPATIAKAESLRIDLDVGNASFQTGDAYALEFADDTFDITCFHALMSYLCDPVLALNQQKRVTKPGGHVIGWFGSWSDQIIYPPCRAFDRYLSACAQLADRSDPSRYFHSTSAREAFALFSQAGFDDIRVEGSAGPFDCVYFGSEFFEHTFEGYRSILQWDGSHAKFHEKLLSIGALDETTVLSAQKEIEAWHDNPHAFLLNTPVVVAAQIP